LPKPELLPNQISQTSSPLFVENKAEPSALIGRLVVMVCPTILAKVPAVHEIDLSAYPMCLPEYDI